MNRKTIALLTSFIAVVLFTVFVLPFLVWDSQNTNLMNIWIVDKTVPDTSYKEHKGLMWALNSEKIVLEETGKPFRYDTDYFGVFPESETSYTVKELPENSGKPDLIYLADTDGVYPSDFNGKDSDEIYDGVPQTPLVGGLSEREMAVLKSALGNKNTIIGEFDIWNSTNQKDLEGIYRVSFTGWRGKYFDDLKAGKNMPQIIVNNYEKQTGEAWNFSGGGLVLVSNEDKVLVLKDRQDLGKKGVQLSFNEVYAQEFDINGSFSYEQWFDLVLPDPSSEILATLTFDVTETGKSALSNFGLSTSYAAIARSENSQYSAYYFSGDFAQMDFSGTLWNYYGFSGIKRILSFVNPNADTKFYWGCYVPMMERIVKESMNKNEVDKTVANFGDEGLTARTSGTGFQVFEDGQWKDFYARGVNIGSTIPGKWFTEFTYDESLYLKWFELIGEMGANTIRVYTLMPPQFYSALVYYNEQHPNQKLWLYQEFWPDENPPDDNYLGEDYNRGYQNEIRMNLDALHGQVNIPQRQGRAYGFYTADVSPYVLGYLVGRELEPEEVISTNEKNPGFEFKGNYLYTESDASPTEAWLAMSCDYVVQYEVANYGWQHPVGIVSWPTLDPAQHNSEWNEIGDKNLQYNDKVSIDINHLSVTEKLKGGFFGAYHIYPNYPDFMNNESSYANYYDEQGSFRYGGYLKEFIAGHQKYPAIVAEFGLATGMGNAHQNPDGYNHGGLSESYQGEGIVRMMKAIKKEGYAGGLIFEWADEWAKKTWITEPYIIPFERNPLWHNAVDPEQNYGIYAMESRTSRSESYVIEDESELKKMSISADETYLYLNFESKHAIDFSNEKLIIGLDTYDRNRGEMKYAEDLSTFSPSGLEFIIDLNGKDDGSLLVQPEYNITTGHQYSVFSETGRFETMSMMTNKEGISKDGSKTDAVVQELSRLTFGSLANNSINEVEIDGKKISIRIPWTRINVSDPSTMRVIDDPRVIKNPTTDELETVVSDGILVSGLLIDKKTNQTLASIGLYNKTPLKWQSWDIPIYQERLKDSYFIISDYFKTLDRTN